MARQYREEDQSEASVHVLRRQALADPVGFWARAAETVPWFKTWDRVFEWQPPTFRWFIGAETNISYNCLDYHVAAGRGTHTALIALDERGGRRIYSYLQLLDLVKQIARGLRGLGIGKGDRVAIYMPTGPEAIAVMLAVTRIGAIHLVVFAGYGSGALAERIRLGGARLLFATDNTYRKGHEVALGQLVSDAVAEAGETLERVVVLSRAGGVPLRAGQDLSWEDFLAGGGGHDDSHESLEANEPAFILATSGTTAKPKLAVHTHGPFQVIIRTMADWLFGLRQSDIWWCTSDIGWMVGHAYIAYAPLMVGCTVVAYEGALDHPGPDTFYQVIQDYQVTGVFMAPTAVRLLLRHGAAVAHRFNLDSITRVVCAGEVLNPAAWEWLQRDVFGDRVPVIDHMWQTETGGPIIGNPFGLGLLPIKPGSAGVPLPGIDGATVRADGTPCAPGEPGVFVVKRPFPGLIASLWGEADRYRHDYWDRIPGAPVYYSGDTTTTDEDGYVWFSGRVDDIIKIAGHRIGTIEVESAFLCHPAVAEAGATGRPDELRGEVIAAFVALKVGFAASDQLRSELLATVRKQLGPVAVIGELSFVQSLPKTRSGKIMRRVLKAVVLDKDPGDVSMIEDAGTVADARKAWQAMKDDIALLRPQTRLGGE